jgi:hypothetical protein
MKKGNSLLKHAALAIGILSTVLLGNLRLQASELSVGPPGRQSADSSSSPMPAPRVISSNPVDPNLYERVGLAGNLADAIPIDLVAMDADEDGVPQDEAQLIPAIYAWDPAVRFVYFRHVSKWM